MLHATCKAAPRLVTCCTLFHPMGHGQPPTSGGLPSLPQCSIWPCWRTTVCRSTLVDLAATSSLLGFRRDKNERTGQETRRRASLWAHACERPRDVDRRSCTGRQVAEVCWAGRTETCTWATPRARSIGPKILKGVLEFFGKCLGPWS